MKFPTKVIVTDQEIDLTKLSSDQKKYFLSLAQDIRNQYEENSKKRLTMSLSGPSGSGKSVTAEILASLLRDEKSFKFIPVDLDAFHYKNKYLEENNLREVKGRHDTYNLQGLEEMLESFKSGEYLKFPRYSRKLHEPVSEQVPVLEENVVLFLAGLWFQRNDPRWNKLRELIDVTYSISGPKEKIKSNTIKRHVEGGRTEEGARVFYENSDLENAREIEECSKPADRELTYFENI